MKFQSSVIISLSVPVIANDSGEYLTQLADVMGLRIRCDLVVNKFKIYKHISRGYRTHRAVMGRSFKFVMKSKVLLFEKVFGNGL